MIVSLLATQLVMLLVTLLLLINHAVTGQQISTERFHAKQDILLSSHYRNASARSRLACCQMCGVETQCQSASYSSSSQECLLSAVEWPEYCHLESNHTEWKACSKRHDFSDASWLLVFRGSPGIGLQPSIAFTDGIGVTSDVTCQQVLGPACAYHYRNPVLDNWNILNPQQVKYAIYNCNTEVAYVTFNATGATISSWWNKAAILDSSYNSNITNQTLVKECILRGVHRDFVINVAGGGTFTQTIREEHDELNNQDVQDSYPQYLYSTVKSYGKPHSWLNIARAHSVAIYIK